MINDADPLWVKFAAEMAKLEGMPHEQLVEEIRAMMAQSPILTLMVETFITDLVNDFSDDYQKVRKPAGPP